MQSFLEKIENSNEFFVKQRFEIMELAGYETRNKYEILDSNQNRIGFAAEQNKGIFNFLIRQLIGHWRKFDILFFDNNQRIMMHAHHPFRWFFQKLNVRDNTGHILGSMEQKFSILNKKFEVRNAKGALLFTMISPIWRIWTFRFLVRESEVARVEKKWSGLLSEAFTDRDDFRILIKSPSIDLDQRRLLISCAVFIDLMYFEKKAKNKS